MFVSFDISWDRKLRKIGENYKLSMIFQLPEDAGIQNSHLEMYDSVSKK
jgi:hypothetical protein